VILLLLRIKSSALVYVVFYRYGGSVYIVLCTVFLLSGQVSFSLISLVSKSNLRALASSLIVYTMSGKMIRASLESHEEKAVSDSASVSTNDQENEPIQRTPTSRTAVDAADGAPLESAISYQSVPAQPSIPDGGMIAWLQVLAGFFMFFNSW
jgi:hypothetical protein